MITPLAATANETDLLTYEVSDETLETAAPQTSCQQFPIPASLPSLAR